MALPSYWVSLNRKDLAEKAIVAKREREANHAQKCKEVAYYHKDLALKSTKYKSLEECQTLKTPRANEESSVKEKIKADKRERLEVRRRRLAHILSIENEQYMTELKEMKEKERERDPWNISRLKEQIEELQRKRKEGEHSMQKRYMHHLYRSSGSCIRENEEEQLKKEVAEAWQQRKVELEKLSLEKKQREEDKYKVLELEQLKATRDATEVEIELTEQKEKWSKFVQEKLNHLNAAETETKKLKVEKEILRGHMETLLSLQQRRQLIRDLQKKGVQRIHSMWQPKEKLRRMSNEVLHALDSDYKLLQVLSDLNNTAAEDTALALLNLDFVRDVKEKIEMQIAMDKNRELEIQQLYNEEASKVWEKRQEEWNLESIARDEIMNDLFRNLANEINKKVDCNLEQQQKFIQLKETCLKEIDEANESNKSVESTLEEKKEYFAEKAKRLAEELQSYNIMKQQSEKLVQQPRIQSPFS